MHDPAWIQAITSIILMIATVATFVVLLVYAADTKKMAKNSSAQIEESQMPLLFLVERTRHKDGSSPWVIQNQGPGAAINIYHSRWLSPTSVPMMSPLSPLGSKDDCAIDSKSAYLQNNPEGFTIVFESVTGKRYRTNIKKVGDTLTTTFEKLN